MLLAKRVKNCARFIWNGVHDSLLQCESVSRCMGEIRNSLLVWPHDFLGYWRCRYIGVQSMEFSPREAEQHAMAWTYRLYSGIQRTRKFHRASVRHRRLVCYGVGLHYFKLPLGARLSDCSCICTTKCHRFTLKDTYHFLSGSFFFVTFSLYFPIFLFPFDSLFCHFCFSFISPILYFLMTFAYIFGTFCSFQFVNKFRFSCRR